MVLLHLLSELSSSTITQLEQPAPRTYILHPTPRSDDTYSVLALHFMISPWSSHQVSLPQSQCEKEPYNRHHLLTIQTQTDPLSLVQFQWLNGFKPWDPSLVETQV